MVSPAPPPTRDSTPASAPTDKRQRLVPQDGPAQASAAPGGVTQPATAASAMMAYVFPSNRANSRFTLGGGPTEILLAGLASHLLALTTYRPASGPGSLSGVGPPASPASASASASAAPPTAPLVLDGIGLVTRLLAGDLQCVEFTRAKGNPFRAPKPKAGAGSSGEPQAAASAPGNLTVKTPLPRRALLFDVAREPTAPSADSAAASADGPATTPSVPVSARAGGGGLGRPRMTLQQLLVCCAASGLCASLVSESRPQDFTVSGNFKEALPAAVEPLRQALLSYLHGLQRLTGCELHVIFPDHGDIECLPAHDLGPLSFAAAKRRFAAALRTQAASAPGPVPGHASSSPDDSPADPCHVMGVGASEQGTYTWCCMFNFKLQPESATDKIA